MFVIPNIVSPFSFLSLPPSRLHGQFLGKLNQDLWRPKPFSCRQPSHTCRWSMPSHPFLSFMALLWQDTCLQEARQWTLHSVQFRMWGISGRERRKSTFFAPAGSRSRIGRQLVNDHEKPGSEEMDRYESILDILKHASCRQKSILHTS